MAPGHYWIWTIGIIFLYTLQEVVAPGGKIDDPINTCKAQYHAEYATKWGSDMSNFKPECVEQCLDTLSREQGQGLFWQGCYHKSSCDDFCICTLDSDSIVRGYHTFTDAMGNIKKSTEGYKSWFAERFEGTMYLAYDCRRQSPRRRHEDKFIMKKDPKRPPTRRRRKKQHGHH